MNSLFDVQGKVVLITGASRGIGKEMATAFADAGAIVYGTASRPESISQGHNPSVQMSVCDVRDRGMLKDLMLRIKATHGRVDALINNAGITSSSLASQVSDEEMQSLFETNLKGLFSACQVYYSTQKREGCIVNISSASAMRAMPGTSFYGSIKAGVIQTTQALAVEWARRNIRVNCISPGFIKTDMNAHLRQNESTAAQIAASIPLGFIGEPADVSGAAVFLVSNAARYITGHNLVIDGGALSRASF